MIKLDKGRNYTTETLIYHFILSNLIERKIPIRKYKRFFQNTTKSRNTIYGQTAIKHTIFLYLFINDDIRRYDEHMDIYLRSVCKQIISVRLIIDGYNYV